jgi:signal transduction histidine kinase
MEGLSASLAEIRTLIEQSIQTTRSLTFELSPPTLHELGLVSTLEWLAEQMQGQHKISITVEGEKEKMPMSDEMRALLFHAVRELLVNVVKHAHARHVFITARRDAGTLTLTVADDGVGQDLENIKKHQSKNGGFGLFNIRERLMHFGGRMEIVSSPAQGTRVELIAPLELYQVAEN